MILTSGDRLALEMLVQLVTEFRASPRKVNTAKLTTMVNLIGRFGMTPSDRSRVLATPSTDADPLDWLQ
jgi:hypothetical protein